MGYKVSKDEQKWIDMQENPSKPPNKVLFGISLAIGYTLEVMLIPMMLVYSGFATLIEKILKRAYK